MLTQQSEEWRKTTENSEIKTIWWTFKVSYEWRKSSRLVDCDMIEEKNNQKFIQFMNKENNENKAGPEWKTKIARKTKVSWMMKKQREIQVMNKLKTNFEIQDSHEYRW